MVQDVIMMLALGFIALAFIYFIADYYDKKLKNDAEELKKYLPTPKLVDTEHTIVIKAPAEVRPVVITPTIVNRRENRREYTPEKMEQLIKAADITARRGTMRMQARETEYQRTNSVSDVVDDRDTDLLLAASMIGMISSSPSSGSYSTDDSSSSSSSYPSDSCSSSSSYDSGSSYSSSDCSSSYDSGSSSSSWSD